VSHAISVEFPDTLELLNRSMMISASIVHLRLRQIFYRNRSLKQTIMGYDELPSPPAGKDICIEQGSTGNDVY
jgi:hypothetical protein